MAETVNWPVGGLGETRIIQGRMQIRIYYSKYNQEWEYVGDQYPEEDFSDWLFMDTLPENLMELLELYGIDANLTFKEWAQHDILGRDVSSTLDPSDCVESEAFEWEHRL